MECSRRCERADNEGSRPSDMKLEKRMSQAETLLERSREVHRENVRQDQHPWGNTSLGKGFKVTFIELKGTLRCGNSEWGKYITKDRHTSNVFSYYLEFQLFVQMAIFCVCTFLGLQGINSRTGFLGKFFYHNITTSANSYCFFQSKGNSNY